MLPPRTKDALAAPDFKENVALIQTIFGENGRAISTLAQLLHTPYRFRGFTTHAHYAGTS